MKRLPPAQRLQMSDDFFGKLLTSGDFFRRQHFFAKIPLHGFEANQVPRNKGLVELDIYNIICNHLSTYILLIKVMYAR